MTLFHMQWLLAALSLSCLSGAFLIAGSRLRGPFRQRILRWNILFVIGAISLISFFNLHSYEQQYTKRSQQVEQEMLEQAKQLIKQRATFLQAWILDENLHAETQLKERLQSIVMQAIETATHLIDTYHTSLNPQQLQQLIVESLRPLRYNNGRGFLFATRLDGTLLFCADHPGDEGRDISNRCDNDGVFYTKKMIDLCRQQGEGFVEYCVDKPGSDSCDNRKISYIHYFKPLNCFIGTGEFWADFDTELQHNIFAKLDHLSSEHGLSIFGASYAGVSLFGPAKGSNVLDVQDINGVFVVKELIQQAQRGGGFVQYQMPASVSSTSYPKMSYCLPIKAWNGYIGAGINLSSLATDIATSKNDLDSTLYSQLLHAAYFLPLIIVLLWYIGRRFSSTIEKNLILINQSLHAAVSNNQHIDLDNICFDEFVAIGKAANAMLDQRSAAESTTRWLAQYDPLTNLANRHHAMECLERLRHHRASGTLWLFMLRVERLKYINSTFGHEAGDHVLQSVAQRILELEAKPLLSARLSSSHFILVIDLQKITAGQMAFILRERITPRISYQDFSLQIDCNIGCVPFASDEVGDLLNKANITVNMVRDNKNLENFLVYDEFLDQNLQKTQKLEADLRRAIDQPQQFLLHFQPIWDINNNYLRGFETLTRWQHPGNGLISPAVFIPLAEEKGLIVRLGEIIFEAACSTMARWLKKYPQLLNEPLRLSVNMAPQQFITDGFIERTTKTLERHGIPNNMLCIEITETSLMEEPELAIQRIRTLNELGIKISIDDFGTGYSSLSYLNQFDVHSVKIDRSLVMNIDKNKTVESISAAIINLAHDLNLHVVAEGIETVAQLDKLHQLGCDSIQGFLLGRPVAEAEAEKLLERRTLVWPVDNT